MTGHRLQLSVSDLMARSREIAGVDIVDDEIVEPLTVLHCALGEEAAQLDAEGARAYEAKFLRLLANRLRMKRDFLRHPEIAEQPVKGPVIVMAVARSGTTKLQKVLAASGDFNFLTFWQGFNWASLTGRPNEPTEARIADADAFCRWYDRRSPETKLGHHFEALEPEEDGPLSEGCFVSPTLVGYAEVPSYAQWLGQQPISIRFAFHRQVMKYLQWQGLACPDRTWLLKSPNYNGLELDILKIFPDARFVVANRSPLQTLPSMIKLVHCFRKAYGKAKPDTSFLMEFNARAMDAHLANRQAHDLPLLDLRFADIVNDVSTVIERVYAHAGMILTETGRDRMLKWNAQNAMHKHGEFKYSLEDAGLEQAVIRERMSSYFDLLDTLAKRAECSSPSGVN